ncbi:MAG: CPBP family intramembrane metalloprotease [Aquificae bacterium]|nr:CPBP family intramembrane metalloprotease [Aquificota bacterium]
MKKNLLTEPYIAIFLLFLLFLFLFLSHFFPFFSNFVIIVLSLPLFLYPLSPLGFKYIKKGFLIGFISSLIYLPFIKFEKVSYIENINIFIFSIFEEIFFRGYLFFALKIKNVHIKNLFISFIFSLAHVILYGDLTKITVFFPSLIFGYLYIYSGSIIAPIIFHIFSNLFYISNFR